MMTLLTAGLWVARTAHSQQDEQITTPVTTVKSDDNTSNEITNTNNVTQSLSYEQIKAAEEAAQRAQKKQELQTIRRDYTKRYQCVVYARLRSGDERVRGWAKHVPTNSETPVEGSVVIFWNGYYGHAAYVEFVDWDERVIYLAEANQENTNYRWGSHVTIGRKVSFDNPYIKGYLKK